MSNHAFFELKNHSIELALELVKGFDLILAFFPITNLDFMLFIQQTSPASRCKEPLSLSFLRSNFLYLLKL